MRRKKKNEKIKGGRRIREDANGMKSGEKAQEDEFSPDILRERKGRSDVHNI